MADEDFSEARPVPQPSASCLLLRQSFLPEGQIFDENIRSFSTTSNWHARSRIRG